MGDDPPDITGAATITTFDQLKALYWNAPWVWWVLPACFAIIFLASFGGAAEGDPAFFSPAVILGFVLLWIAIIVISFRRYSRAQRQVRYRITAERVEVSDAAGALVAVPWTGIKRTKEVRSAFLLRLKPAGVRWLPKRAFSADAVNALRVLIAKRLGAQAKLRE